MIRAILANTKTQMRRIFKPDRMTWDANGRYTTHAMRGGELSTTGSGPFKPSSWLHYCPYGQPGDRLWVRETFYSDPEDGLLLFRADGGFDGDQVDAGLKWRPSIFMPRWASRLTLEITGVRVERLQDISEADAQAEGIERVGGEFSCTPWRNYRIGRPDEMRSHCAARSRSYMTLWESINGPGSWAANPWVWVVEFKLVGNGGEG